MYKNLSTTGRIYNIKLAPIFFHKIEATPTIQVDKEDFQSNQNLFEMLAYVF